MISWQSFAARWARWPNSTIATKDWHHASTPCQKIMKYYVIMVYNIGIYANIWGILMVNATKYTWTLWVMKKLVKISNGGKLNGLYSHLGMVNIPLFIGFQPSFWWWISSIHSISEYLWSCCPHILASQTGDPDMLGSCSIHQCHKLGPSRFKLIYQPHCL